MRYGMTLEQMKQELEKRLKPSRFRHSLGVAETAVKLAKRFGADEEQARVAGLLHDCAREFRNEDMVKEAEKRGIAIGEVERVFVDSATWRVESLQVTLRKESAERIGVKHGLFHKPVIEIATRLVQSVGDAVVLAIPLDALRTPEEAVQAEPGAAPPVH